MNRWLQNRLDLERKRRQAESLWRRTRAPAPSLIDLGSNDYLGLSRHPQVLEGARRAVDAGGGARASRLLGGDHDEVRALESDLARWKGGPGGGLRSLVFASGYAANLGTLTALAEPGDLLLCDKRNHASLIDAARLAEASGARVRFYGSPEKLRAVLEGAREGSGERSGAWIVSDTVYSMDGDIADVAALLRLARDFDTAVLLDDAHGTGVLGACGRGALEAAGLEEAAHASDVAVVTVGTLSKALGAQGGFVTARSEIIDWLVNTSRPFIYSTGIAPAACGAARAALQVLESEPHRLQRLDELAVHFARELQSLGFEAPHRGTPILPVLAGEAKRAVRWSEALQEEGVWCPPVRPPTVSAGTSRLRASLRADLTDGEVEHALEAFASLRVVVDIT